MKRDRVSRLRVPALVGLLTGFVIDIAPGIEPGGEALARDLAQCAAFFFNATNARPMEEYERLYGAGERAVNRAMQILGRATVDRLIGDASVEMTADMGQDWRNFGRIEARLGAQCWELVGIDRK